MVVCSYGSDWLRSLPLVFLAVSGIIGTTALAAGKKADFSKFVVAGDSLSAGYQNSQLIESGQIHGYASVIAAQARADLNLPLLPSPGYPQISIQDGFAVVVGLSPIGRLNNQQTLDVAVPGFTMGALVGYEATCSLDPLNPIQVMAALILNPNCLGDAPTQLEEAAALQPTTSVLWVGNNDALFTILFGGDPTDTATFGSLYQIAASTMAKASRSLVLANIPDVTLVPYLTSIDRLAGVLNLPVPQVEAALGLNPGDMVTPYAFAVIQAMGTSLTALPESVQEGPVVLRASRISQIRAAVLAYNEIIATQAAATGATLVDVYSLVNDLAAHGTVVGGRKLTTGFMGGLFSLDGIHLTNTGYAIVANEFIKTMNRSLAAGIPPASIEQVSKTDPLIFSDSHPGKRNGHVSESMADVLRAVLR
jgi:lysophospholipase L1-like esterase